LPQGPFLSLRFSQRTATALQRCSFLHHVAILH
jgi:hypothetical protein